jgi:hypothetical protein
MKRLFAHNYDLAGVQAIYSKGELIYRNGEVGTDLRRPDHNSDIQNSIVTNDVEA